jgi:hypothetical protein
VLYFVSVFTAVFNEFVVHGRLGFTGILVPIACQVAVALLLYGILKPVNRAVASLALFCQFVTLALEALRFEPRGVNAGMAFHGIFCLLLGYLIVRSSFLPRILGVLMSLAGLVWLIYLSPTLANILAPYNTAFGLLGEGLPMLWLAVVGLNPSRWREQAGEQKREQVERAARA